MIFPSLHLNGTSREELEQQIENATSAINTAIRKLNDAAPNGRDYYPQGETAIIIAQKEHQSRVERLKSVYDELFTIYENITD